MPAMPRFPFALPPKSNAKVGCGKQVCNCGHRAFTVTMSRPSFRGYIFRSGECCVPSQHLKDALRNCTVFLVLVANVDPDPLLGMYYYSESGEFVANSLISNYIELQYITSATSK